MKKILIIFMLPLLLLSCKKDNIGSFEVLITPDRFEFEPIAGGAVMTFELSEEHSEVFQVEVSYVNDWNVPVVKSAYVLSGELILDGLIKGGDIPVTIYLKNNKNERSEPLELMFEAYESYASSILQDGNIDIEPYWNGFRILIDDMPEETAGFVNVYYVGKDFKDDITNIPVGKFNINDSNMRSRYILDEELYDENDNITIVLETSDLKENIIAKREFEVSYLTAKMLSGVVMHSTSIKNSHETADYSWQALFDGYKNQKGSGSSYYTTFLSKGNMDQSEWIFDLGDNREPLGYLRMYTQYWIATDNYFPSPFELPEAESDASPAFYNEGLSIRDRLPSDMEIYASESIDGEWVKIGEYFSPDGSKTFLDAWCYGASNAADITVDLVSRGGVYDASGLPEIYVEVDFSDANNTPYRYVMVKVLDNFSTFGEIPGTTSSVNDLNTTEQLSFSEIEFFVKE